jgi:hypothetical protein
VWRLGLFRPWQAHLKAGFLASLIPHGKNKQKGRMREALTVKKNSGAITYFELFNNISSL